jgi:hypothetical protein
MAALPDDPTPALLSRLNQNITALNNKDILLVHLMYKRLI